MKTKSKTKPVILVNEKEVVNHFFVNRTSYAAMLEIRKHFMRLQSWCRAHAAANPENN